MTDFDTLLKRSFAEIGEPADDGFSVAVAQTVAKREAWAKVSGAVQAGFMVLAAMALAYGAYLLATFLGVEQLMSFAFDEVAEARGALGSAPSASEVAESVLSAMGAGMTQVLLIMAALAGGAVAYRASQD
jgi:hypothetical protein